DLDFRCRIDRACATRHPPASPRPPSPVRRNGQSTTSRSENSMTASFSAPRPLTRGTPIHLVPERLGSRVLSRGKRQLAIACKRLVARAGLARLWTEDGPTNEARTLLGAGHGTLPPRERLLLLAAWAFWDGSESERLADALRSPNGDPLEELR